jgi:predicted nucleotidyltransferase component of viral defense system
MKDYCLELAASQSGANAKLNIMREYLQAYVLRVLHDEGFFRAAAFVGGTALRFLYGLPRFSEDLDFSGTRGISVVHFAALAAKIDRELKAANYDVSVVTKIEKTVFNAMVKFSGLLHEAGLSPMASQKFSIKIEIDTRPPAGAALKTQIVNKYFPISFLSYDVSSLFSGKCHALLSRKYSKGRDFFDLGWYLSRWKDISPNFKQLNNALEQTGWGEGVLDESNWLDHVGRVVKRADWKKVKPDVINFLENPKDADVFSRENILNLLTQRGAAKLD